MNFILISPHFPENFEPFALRLAEKGVNVFGIADCPYDELSPNLKRSLTEYYRVDNMENYEEMYKAVAYLCFRHGRMDALESQNEYWLLQDARLRTDFNIPGRKLSEMDDIKYKSRMKEVFRSAGIPVARGRVVKDYEDILTFIKTVGYPICIKPDSGVGGEDAHRINNKEDLDRFYESKKDQPYIMEEFVFGDTVTYDGLTDEEGNIVFESGLVYSETVLEITDNDLDMYFYATQDLPQKLVEMGRKAVKAFDVKSRFFHLEFFHTKDDDYVALEMNCRPPGGASIDLMNYCSDMDLFAEYANVMLGRGFTSEQKNRYYAASISRKGEDYRHSLDEVRDRYGDSVLYISKVPPVFQLIMGDYTLVVRTESKEDLMEMTEFILQR